MTRYASYEWDTKLVKTLSDIHKYHGYALIAISQVTVSLGMAYYLLRAGKKPLAIGLSVGNATLFAAIVTVFEILNCNKKKEPLIMLTKSDVPIYAERFTNMIKEGRKLVILES